jgi:NAD(P)-dependent dehydrogenase (short-subunit alcohol dehydrogenase family)
MPVDPAPSGKSNEIYAPGLMKGKVLYVTGGGSGIGLGICIAFARLGARVAICGRTESKLKDAAQAIQRAGAEDVMFMKCDVRNPEQCVAAANAVGEKWGKIDVFVSNAAGNFMSLLEDVSPNAFSTVMDIDLRGTFHTAKAALPWLRKASQGGGGALMISISATLYYTAMPFQGHAAAAKAGIDSLTKTFAAEWSSDGIRVVSIAPGPIADTEGGPSGRVFGSAGAPKMDIRMTVPLGRYGTVDDIANTAIFLASPGGNFISGTNVVVDGMQWQAVGVSGMLSMKDRIRSAMLKQKEGRERGTGSKGHSADVQAKL